jgi:2-succinyl-5-enolpyruvyl-6-hydroxy-3-cyclohexene-1-carboxylate synthase
MTTDKKPIQLIARVLHQCGLKNLIVCPGSRSAPLVIAFNAIPEIKKWVIPDERSAAYFALGMARETGQTTAILTTSGTAVLNLGPAICEAFYQKIPLLAITADRPAKEIDQGENQTIRQEGVFQNYIRHQVSIEGDQKQPDCELMAKMLTEVWKQSQLPCGGPVHLNVSLREPLYRFAYQEEMLYSLSLPSPSGLALSAEMKDKLKSAWNAHQRKMIIVGEEHPDAELLSVVAALSNRPDVVVVADHLSNMPGCGAIYHTEGTLSAITADKLPLMIPDLVISTEGRILSKNLKNWLRAYPPKQHWHISKAGDKWNYFGVLKAVFNAPTRPILAPLADTPPAEILFNKIWQQCHTHAINASRDFMEKIPFCDMKVMESILKSIPSGSVLHLGNSSSVRYAGFFPPPVGISMFSNRGTSGIDGSVSTAAGAAAIAEKLHVCVLGDQSALYDSNGLWHNYLKGNFRLIVINNGGGNIFRWLPGATAMEHFETYQEARHGLDFEFLAKQFGLDYYLCRAAADLDFILTDFLQTKHNKAGLLEIKTNNELSADVYKSFINALKPKQT